MVNEKRDVSREIKALKGRKEFNTLYDSTLEIIKLKPVISSITDENSLAQQQILKSIPVSLAAFMESFMRSMVKRLIDHGDPYFENSKAFFQNSKLKIDFELFKNIHKKEFTLGELLSHQLPCSRHSDFISAFDILLDRKFIIELKKYKQKGLFDYSQNVMITFPAKCDSILANVAKVFELRHIICHEASLDVKLTKSLANELCDSVLALLTQTKHYLLSLLDPEYYLSDKERKSLLKTKYKASQSKLNKLIKMIKSNPIGMFEEKINIDMFSKSQELWLEQISLYCKSHLFFAKQNFDYSLEEIEMLIDFTEDRIEDLKVDFEIDE